MRRTQPSVLFQTLSGKAGSVVFVNPPDSATYIRPRTLPHDPRTPEQLAQRARMTRAREAYRQLSPEQFQAWHDYLHKVRRAQTPASPPTRLRVCDLFLALALKYLQMHPDAEPPRNPPADLFVGDAVSVRVEAVAGGIRFVADRPNQAGVWTELLVAQVRSWGACPNAHAFRHRGFVQFGEGGLEVVVSVSAGLYACGVRFVREATGQFTPLVRVGMVQVMG